MIPLVRREVGDEPRVEANRVRLLRRLTHGLLLLPAQAVVGAIGPATTAVAGHRKQEVGEASGQAVKCGERVNAQA